MINFTKVEYTTRNLKKQLTIGEIDQKTFEARLMDLVDIAADGYYWMFGHKTETWYRHDGEQWIQKDPGKLRMLESSISNSPTEPQAASNPSFPTNSTAQPNLIADWKAINWGWFITSLIVMGLIGSVVYASV